ncbi:bromodomain-containing protein 8 isoform X2 [Scleropages formosus]|uniref:Bromodomain-containing protein 8 n=1 Tax=Scleropages formosus TaxID=113540 RepID=A0A8C9RK05_SCLFO|nr:bromodomain-containing protein 8-like isoform X2 [Scleropages formosus]
MIFTNSKMASGVGKHKMLALGPTEPWSVREKLCLASSVMRSGDQNWVSVSRAIKPFSEPGRPPDWFSQKHCASQYSELLETTEAPKRKRGEKGEVVETVEDVIVRRLTAERIEELKKLLRETQERYRKLKKEAEMIQAGQLDSKLEELWGEIVQKRKQDEEEAEQKRKATDAAYQARQAAKNTPKRVPSVTVRSPIGVGSPAIEGPATDRHQTPEDQSSTPTTPGTMVFAPLPEVPGPVAVEASMGNAVEDSPQKKLLNQKGTPPPSPLLSELLKKGSLLSASTRWVGDGEATTGLTNGPQRSDSQFVAAVVPQSSASNGAPMLSHLLEAGPTPQCAVTQDSMSTNDLSSAPSSEAEPAAPDDSSTLNSGGDVAVEMEASASPLPEEEKVEELPEEELVTVSYMEDDLDLETVGDIIAIIEEKVDDSSEALDAAAVEAALCLCEEAAAAHALAEPWESEAFKAIESTPIDPAVSAEHTTPVSTSVGPSPALRATEAETELPEDTSGEPGPEEEAVLSTSLETDASACLESAPLLPADPDGAQSQNMISTQNLGLQPDTQDCVVVQEGQEDGGTPSHTVKIEVEEWTQQEPDAPCVDSEDSSVSGKDTKMQEVKEEDGGSDGEEGSVSELKEPGEQDGADGEAEAEGDGAYLSELEPAASESEDGYSLHASSLHRYTSADSVPSSPASSQFSMSSEDQEALQAQKIWKKAIMLVWRAAANHRYASVFLQPVSDDIAPGYHSIVHRPMDLSVIKKNIESGVIRTTAEFQRDIMLMFQNAVMYNSSDHDVYHMALEMQRDVLEQIQQFLATQLIMQTSESGISAKSLRGRETARRQDSSEKDGGTRGRRCAIEADLKMKK